MKTVRQLLQDKDNGVWSVSPHTTVFDALKLMADKQIGALMVMEDSQLVGIITERDYARKLILQDKSSRETPVGEVMTSRVLYVLPEQSVEDCMALMTDKHIRHLPVLDNGQLLGVISMRDVVKDVVAEHKFMISQLENYITGTQ